MVTSVRGIEHAALAIARTRRGTLAHRPLHAMRPAATLLLHRDTQCPTDGHRCEERKRQCKRQNAGNDRVVHRNNPTGSTGARSKVPGSFDPLRRYRAIHAAPKHLHRHSAAPPQGFPDGLAPGRNGSISAHNCGLNPTPPPCYRMPCPRTDTARNLVNINRIPTPRRLDFFPSSELPMSRARASAQRRADTSQGAPSTWLSSVR